MLKNDHWPLCRKIGSVFLSILGPSICGKSTPLRLIDGLEQTQLGRIVTGGRGVKALPPADLHVSMVFQSYALFPHLGVAENMVFGLKVWRVARAEHARRPGEVLEMTGLEELGRRRPSEPKAGSVHLRVYVPAARATYLAYALVLVATHWNNFLWTLIVTNSPSRRPLTLGLFLFAALEADVDISVIWKGAVSVFAPLLIGFLIFQRQYVQAFLTSGVK